MLEGQNQFRIRSIKGSNQYQVTNVHRGIIPSNQQPEYCDKCEVRNLCRVEGNPPINRIISLSQPLITRCQRALQQAKGMSVPVKDQDFAPSIIARNVQIPCLQDKATDPYPTVKEVTGNFWWNEKD
jgi:hypothetical protein